MMLYLLASVGFVLSAYLLWVKRQLNKDPTYQPFCDLSGTVSCSAVLKSPYADLFFLPNALVGIFFYVFIILTHILQWQLFVIAFSLFATVVSIFLAGMLVSLRKLCIVCVLTYLTNALLLIISLQGVFF